MPEARPRKAMGCGGAAVICFVVLLVAVAIVPEDETSVAQSLAATAPPPVSADTLDSCRALLADGQREGLIRERPSPTRIDVEDAVWAALPATAKEGVLKAVACDVFGRGALVGLEGPVVAYGYRNGRRAAMLTSVGVTFER